MKIREPSKNLPKGPISSAKRLWKRRPKFGSPPNTKGVRTSEEISQLLYHLQVLMIKQDLKLEDIYRYL